MSERVTLFVSGGRYPTDPVSGSVAGRYATAGVRLRTALPRPPASREPRPLPRPPAGADGEPGAAAQLDVQAAPDGTVRLVLYAPGAATVELAADFTDWQPIALRRLAPAGSAWETVTRIPPGMHRVNVRIDGGDWIVPFGTTRAADDFGGAVGLVTVP